MYAKMIVGMKNLLESFVFSLYINGLYVIFIFTL